MRKAESEKNVAAAEVDKWTKQVSFGKQLGVKPPTPTGRTKAEASLLVAQDKLRIADGELNHAKDVVAKAEGHLAKAKDRLDLLEKNDPPLDREVEAARRRVAEVLEEIERKKAEAEGERTKAKYAAERKKEEAEAEARRKAEEEYDVNGLVLLLKTIEPKRTRFGGEISGTVVNRRGRKLGYVQITFNLYDENGSRVGTALANINDLEPGDSCKFKATTFGTDYKSYKFSELIGR